MEAVMLDPIFDPRFPLKYPLVGPNPIQPIFCPLLKTEQLSPNGNFEIKSCLNE
jgi:hypothetical protein